MQSAMDDHLEFLYQQLRLQLDLAYAAPKWDAARIALITSDLLTLECQLARRDAHGLLPTGYLGTLPGSGAAALHAVM